MRRVAVMGCSGSGKTTLARRLAAEMGLAHIELDAIFHQPGWTELPTDEFRRRVTEACQAEAWVSDGNDGLVRDIVLAHCDTVVMLDLPRAVVMRQVIARTLRRGWSQEELWNGNRERRRQILRPDPMRNIVLWAWTTHAKFARRYVELSTDPALTHLTLVRLRSNTEIEAWHSSVTAGTGL